MRQHSAEATIVVKTTTVNNNLNADSKNLQSIRKKLDLSQAQMAGLLGLNRSYLAELETGRRPVQDWILKKAQAVDRRISGINLVIPNAGSIGEVEDLVEFTEAVSLLTVDELGEISDHLLENLHDAPRVALLFYESAIKIVLTELRRRSIAFHQTKVKKK